MADIVKRSGRLPYYEVDGKFLRMCGFTELSTSKKAYRIFEKVYRRGF